MPIIGLDLGRHRFRAVELEKEKGFFVLKNYGQYTAQPLDLDFSDEDKLNRYSQEVHKFIRDHGFTTSHTIVALPEQDVFIRVLKAPKMNNKELRNFISLEADEYIPTPLSQVTFDVQVIGEDPAAVENERMTVLLVASKNDVLQRYVNFIKRAGLTPRAIEPETLSIERVLGDTLEHPAACIIVNIGVASTQIIVSYKGYVRFTRSIPIGGDELTKAVQKTLGLDYHQANEYKKAYGLEEFQVEGKVYNAIKPVFDTILLEINKSKMYYTTHNPDVMINRVILSGGTALMPGLLIYIANKLDVEAELSNPWRKIKIDQKLKDRREELMASGPVYSTAVGLALKEI